MSASADAQAGAVLRKRPVRYAGNFTIIHNSYLRDSSLSYRARGILAYLLSLDDGYEIGLRRIIEGSEHEGRSSVESALDQLLECGYLTRERHRNARGHHYWEWTLATEVATPLPPVDNFPRSPRRDSPRAGDQHVDGNVHNPRSTPDHGNPRAGDPHADYPNAGDQHSIEGPLVQEITPSGSATTERPTAAVESAAQGLRPIIFWTLPCGARSSSASKVLPHHKVKRTGRCQFCQQYPTLDFEPVEDPS